MSQPIQSPQPVPSEGDLLRARRFLDSIGIADHGSVRRRLAEEFAAARFEELSAGDPKELPLAEGALLADAPTLLRALAERARRETLTLSPELGTAELPMPEGQEGVRILTLTELEDWLGGLAVRVEYLGLSLLGLPSR